MHESIPGKEQQMQRPCGRTELGTDEELKGVSLMGSKGENGGGVQPSTWCVCCVGSGGWYFILGEVF